MKKLMLLLGITASILACNNKSKTPAKKILPSSNGRINELLVVTNDTYWEGKIGSSIQKIVADTLVGLPQPEVAFDISQVGDRAFSSMFKASRALLKVGISHNEVFTIEKNVFAEPQIVVTVNAKSEQGLINKLTKHKTEIRNAFRDLGIETIQRKVKNNHWEASKIETLKKHHYSFNIPRNYKKVDDTGDFIWYRHRLNGNGNSMEIVSYVVPIKSKEDEEGKTIINNRNSIGEKYLRGETKDSYMITEKAYTPQTIATTLANQPAFETRGKWEIKGPYMAAGPFINYTVVDKENNQLIVIEGFVYAPAKNKRDYIFELEAIAKTLTLEK